MDDTTTPLIKTTRARLDYLEQVVERRERGFFRQASTYLSLASLLIAVLTGSIAVVDRFYVSKAVRDQAARAELNANLREISEINVRYVEANVFSAQALDPREKEKISGVLSALNTRKYALVSRSRRLLDDLGGEVGSSELIALSGELAVFADIPGAVDLGQRAVDRATQETERSSANMNLGIVLFLASPAQDVARGRAAYDEAIAGTKRLGGLTVPQTLYQMYTNYIISEAVNGDCARANARAQEFADYLAATPVPANFPGEFRNWLFNLAPPSGCRVYVR